IGVAFGSQRTTLGLALRVPKRQGIAYRAAVELADSATNQGSWADVRIVETVSVPSRSEIAVVDTKLVDANAFPVGDDPLMLGVSVGHPKAPAGSLGGFVKIKGAGEGIIGACHIIANGGRGIVFDEQTGLGPYVYHPASGDAAGNLTMSNQIG